MRGEPFHLTTEPSRKFIPFTVKVKAGSPAILLVGERDVMVGIGLLTMNVWALEVPPPGAGFKTVTEAVPAVAMSAAVINAVSWVALT